MSGEDSFFLQIHYFGPGGDDPGFIDLGDHEAAARIYELLLPFADQVVCTQVFTMRGLDGILGGLAALLGETEAAEVHFARAEELTKAIGAHWSSANDDLARAVFCHDIGQTDRAQDYVSRCLTTSREHGYADVERRARELLTTLAATA